MFLSCESVFERPIRQCASKSNSFYIGCTTHKRGPKIGKDEAKYPYDFELQVD